MKTVEFLNNLFKNQTVQSAIRHGLTILGAWLTSRGLSMDNVLVSMVTSGIALGVVSTLWGAINELVATKSWKHFGFSVTRHVVLDYGCTLAVSSGWIGQDFATNLLVLLGPVVGTLWGVGDEAVADSKTQKS